MNTILFDLDGTVLPLDMDKFLEVYFKELGKSLSHICDPKILVNNIWAATKAMIENTELRTNEEVFMEAFGNLIEDNLKDYQEQFDLFYDNGFLKAKETTFENKWIKKAVNMLKDKGYTLVLATNPLFPLKAIHHRIKWSGFNPDDFSYITSYENNHYCKPQLKYYEEILSVINKRPEECMMVGNDVTDDMVAGELGIKTFLIDDCLVNNKNHEIKADNRGNYKRFYQFVEGLPDKK